MPSTVHVNLTKYIAGRAQSHSDTLAVEEPLELQLLAGVSGHQKQQSISVTMRTPGHDDSLSVGFLFTEGIINNPSQIQDIEVGAGGENTVLVRLSTDFVPVLNKAERNFYTTSSCGVCGKSSMDAIKTVCSFSIKDDAICVSASVLDQLPAKLREQQRVFNSTGGLHASALFTGLGDFISLQEDVGRHNALDKLIGAAFLQDELPLSNRILLLSGRASFELVQKAAMAGIPIIAAIGAPSSLAVSLAEEQGITLIGFLREDRFNVYTHPRRVSQ